MNTNKTAAAIKIVASLILIAVCLWALARSSGGIKFRFPDLSLHRGYTNGDYTEENAYIKDLDIDWTFGDVTVIFSKDGSASAVSEKSDYLYWKKQSDGTLKIEGPKGVFQNFSRSDLTVKLPEGMSMNSVDIEAVSGNIEYSACDARKGSFEAVSGAMDITGSFLEFDLASVSGGITARGSFEKADIETVSGDAELTADSSLCSVDFESVSGDLTLNLPENTGFSLDFESVSGDFSCSQATQKNGNKYVYEGGDVRIDAETVSGDVKIN